MNSTCSGGGAEGSRPSTRLRVPPCSITVAGAALDAPDRPSRGGGVSGADRARPLGRPLRRKRGRGGPAELLPIAVIEHGALTFDSFVRPGEPVPYWFRVKSGRVVSDYPILPGLLNVPAFAAAKVAGVSLYEHRFRLSLLTAAALASFSVLFLFLALRHVCRSEIEAFAFALLYAAGTEVWSVAGKGLFQHGPSLFFLTLALWMLLDDGPWATAVAGLALGFAVVNRPTNALIAAPLAFYALRNRRRGSGASRRSSSCRRSRTRRTRPRTGEIPSLSRSGPRPGAIPGNPAQGLAGMLVSPSRGLFVFSPFLLFAIPAGVAAWRRSGALFDRCLVAAVLLTLAVYSRWRVWWGGHSFGYRLLIEIVPVLVLLIAGYWPEIARRVAVKAAFGFLAAASIFIQFLGATRYPSGFNETIDQEPERLWQVRDSEIHRLARGLFVPATAAMAAGPLHSGSPSSRVPTPAPRWWTAAANNDALLASLDWPRADAAVRGPLRVSGWAGSAAGPVEVQILLAPGDRAIPVGRGPRLDVCSGVPDLRDCSKIGFVATLPPPDAPLQEQLIVVELRGPGGTCGASDRCASSGAACDRESP